MVWGQPGARDRELGAERAKQEEKGLRSCEEREARPQEAGRVGKGTGQGPTQHSQGPMGCPHLPRDYVETSDTA